MVESIQFTASSRNSCLITIGKTVKLLCGRTRSRLLFLASTTLSTIAKQLFMLGSNSRIPKLRTGFSQGLPSQNQEPNQIDLEINHNILMLCWVRNKSRGKFRDPAVIRTQDLLSTSQLKIKTWNFVVHLYIYNYLNIPFFLACS